MSDQTKYENLKQRLSDMLGGSPTPKEKYQIGLSFDSRRILVGWVPKYWAVLQSFADCMIYAEQEKDDTTFGEAKQGEKRDGPIKSDLLKLFIMQCHAKSGRLTAEEYNNLGYAYASLPEPDLKNAESAFQQALRRAKTEDVKKQIQENLKTLEELKPSLMRQRWLTPSDTSLLPLFQEMRDLALEIAQGKAWDIRLMTDNEIASLESIR